jgi:Fur family ferric uptake transcriptional regulator
MNNKYVEMLQERSIKPTANRLLIVRTLANAGRPLSMAEIESDAKTIDKSIISRTLSLFRDKHLVHAVEAGGDSVRYELCRSHFDDEHDDMHVHFYCERCHRTFCLESPVPCVEVPEGYLVTSVNYMIKGVCPECADD